MATLCNQKTLILQWLSSHCGLHVIDTSDYLAKEVSKEDHPDNSITNSGQRTISKSKQKDKWEREHPLHNKNNP